MRRKPVAVAVAALDPVVAMLGYNEFAMRSGRNDEVRAQAAQAARQASSEVERIVEGLHSLLISVRFMPAVQNLDPAVWNASLRSVASSVPNERRDDGRTQPPSITDNTPGTDTAFSRSRPSCTTGKQ